MKESLKDVPSRTRSGAGLPAALFSKASQRARCSKQAATQLRLERTVLGCAVALVGALSLFMAGCRGTTEGATRPDRAMSGAAASAARDDTGAGTAQQPLAEASDEGVRVTVLRDTWTGAAAIAQKVTPIKVRIQNNSGKPLRFSYDKLELEDASGDEYDALPPFKLEGSVSELKTATTYTPIATPDWTYQGFYVEPYYGWLYPSLSPFNYEYKLDYDLDWYATTHAYWAETQLPTSEMLNKALPEGVINDGGHIDGYVYFKKVSEDVERQRQTKLELDLVNASNGEEFGEVEVPLDLSAHRARP